MDSGGRAPDKRTPIPADYFFVAGKSSTNAGQ
jgi:hypothetical protein